MNSKMLSSDTEKWHFINICNLQGWGPSTAIHASRCTKVQYWSKHEIYWTLIIWEVFFVGLLLWSIKPKVLLYKLYFLRSPRLSLWPTPLYVDCWCMFICSCTCICICASVWSGVFKDAPMYRHLSLWWTSLSYFLDSLSQVFKMILNLFWWNEHCMIRGKG